MDRPGTKVSACQTALVVKGLSRYDIDIAALGQTRLPLHDSIAKNGYTLL